MMLVTPEAAVREATWAVQVGAVRVAMWAAAQVAAVRVAMWAAAQVAAVRVAMWAAQVVRE
jgi:hypothetical protein